MLEVKNIIMLFSNTLAVRSNNKKATRLKYCDFNILFPIYFQNYGYNVTQLAGVLQDIREHYNDVLMQKCVRSFREIFDQDSYQIGRASCRERV